MRAIPAGADATRAWEGLSADVRLQALARAESGLPHPDPAVAAIVVGAVRRRAAVVHRRQRILVPPALAFLAGGLLGLVFVGRFAYAGATAMIVFGGLVLAIVTVVAAAEQSSSLDDWPRPYAVPPNLALLLVEAVDATGPGPDAREVLVVERPRPQHRWLWVWPVVLLLTAVTTALLLGRPWTPLTGLAHAARDLVRNLPLLLVVTVLNVAYSGLIGWRRRRRQGPKPPAPAVKYAPLRIDAAGLAFGRDPAIPWSEVGVVAVAGPTPDTPETPLSLRWTLADGRIELRADGLTAAPETIVLASLAYTRGRERT